MMSGICVPGVLQMCGTHILLKSGPPIKRDPDDPMRDEEDDDDGEDDEKASPEIDKERLKSFNVRIM